MTLKINDKLILILSENVFHLLPQVIYFLSGNFMSAKNFDYSGYQCVAFKDNPYEVWRYNFHASTLLQGLHINYYELL